MTYWTQTHYCKLHVHAVGQDLNENREQQTCDDDDCPIAREGFEQQYFLGRETLIKFRSGVGYYFV